jgi:hypothetical protein
MGYWTGRAMPGDAEATNLKARFNGLQLKALL